MNILFYFSRLPADQVTNLFVREIRNWLRILVAFLLRCSGVDDHLFLLEQLVATTGIRNWGVDLLQIPSTLPASISASDVTSTFQYVLKIFSILLKPIKLKQHKSETPTPGANNPAVGKNPATETVSFILEEDDILSLFQQLPIQQIFLNLFKSYPVKKKLLLQYSKLFFDICKQPLRFIRTFQTIFLWFATIILTSS